MASLTNLVSSDQQGSDYSFTLEYVDIIGQIKPIRRFKDIVFSASYSSNNDDTLKFTLNRIYRISRGSKIVFTANEEKYEFIIRTIKHTWVHNSLIMTVSCSTQFYKFLNYPSRGGSLGTDIVSVLKKVADNVGINDYTISDDSNTKFKKPLMISATETYAASLNKNTTDGTKKVKFFFFYMDARNVIYFEPRKKIESGADYKLILTGEDGGESHIISLDYEESDTRKITAVRVRTPKKEQGEVKQIPSETEVNVVPDLAGLNSKVESKSDILNDDKEGSESTTIAATATNTNVKSSNIHIEEVTKKLTVVLSYLYAPLVANRIIEVEGVGDYTGNYRIQGFRYDINQNKVRTTLMLESSEENKIKKPKAITVAKAEEKDESSEQGSDPLTIIPTPGT